VGGGGRVGVGVTVQVGVIVALGGMKGVWVGVSVPGLVGSGVSLAGRGKYREGTTPVVGLGVRAAVGVGRRMIRTAAAQ
jgi:hypothetical protein